MSGLPRAKTARFTAITTSIRARQTGCPIEPGFSGATNRIVGRVAASAIASASRSSVFFAFVRAHILWRHDTHICRWTANTRPRRCAPQGMKWCGLIMKGAGLSSSSPLTKSVFDQSAPR
jgi:hypothetical protein